MKKIFFIILSFSLFIYALSTTEERFLKASESGDYTTVTNLIGKVDVNIATEDGVTALMLASHNGYISIVRELLKNNAKINVADEVGYTPLLFASSAGHSNIVKLLIRNNADVNATNIYGENALHLSSYKLNKEIVKILVATNININATNNDGYNALYLSFMSAGKSEDIIPIAEILTTNGADINLKGKNGKYLLTYVKESYKQGEVLIEFLEKNGAIEEDTKK